MIVTVMPKRVSLGEVLWDQRRSTLYVTRMRVIGGGATEITFSRLLSPIMAPRPECDDPAARR